MRSKHGVRELLDSFSTWLLNLHKQNSPLHFPRVSLDVVVKKIKSISSPRIELKPIRLQTDAVSDM